MKGQDYYAFEQAGLAADFDAISGYHLFMVCETSNPAAFRNLQPGYTFRLCRRDELETWKRLAHDMTYDKPDLSYVTAYYNSVYASREEEFYNRCIFVCDSNDNPVATGIPWRAYGRINVLDWVMVTPGHEGKGLGRVLVSELLNRLECPIYLHTQPTSIRAIKLYSDFGFKLVTDPAVGYRENNLPIALPIMERVMHKNEYAKLQFTTADAPFLEAALLRKQQEF